MRSSLVRIGRMGSTFLLSALGRSSPWRETLGIMRQREAEGMPLEEESFRKMCLGDVWIHELKRPRVCRLSNFTLGIIFSKGWLGTGGVWELGRWCPPFQLIYLKVSSFKDLFFTYFYLFFYGKRPAWGETPPSYSLFSSETKCKHMTSLVGVCNFWRLLGLTRSRAWQMASWCLGCEKNDWHLQHNMLHG